MRRKRSGLLSSGSTGAMNELVAAADLMRLGLSVFRALSPACASDLIILDGNGQMVTIEVRTAKIFGRRLGFPRQRLCSDIIAAVVKGVVYYQFHSDHGERVLGDFILHACPSRIFNRDYTLPANVEPPADLVEKRKDGKRDMNSRVASRARATILAVAKAKLAYPHFPIAAIARLAGTSRATAQLLIGKVLTTRDGSLRDADGIAEELMKMADLKYPASQQGIVGDLRKRRDATTGLETVTTARLSLDPEPPNRADGEMLRDGRADRG